MSIRPRGRRPGTAGGFAPALLGILLLAACAARVSLPADGPVAEPHPRFVVGEPYELGGVWYYPDEDYTYDRTGLGVVLSGRERGQLTANGEAYDPDLLTAAHRTLPLPSLARVTNLDTGRSVVVRINDRGPADPGRILAVSPKAAEMLGVGDADAAKLRVSVLPRESRILAAPLRAVAATAVTPGIADDGSPTPMAAPRPTVVVEGAGPISSPASARDSTDLATLLPGSVAQDGRFLPAPVAVQVPVGPARSIWVEAGEFTDLNAASGLRARLSGIAASVIDSRAAGRAQEFRVRLGPFGAPQAADAALRQVLDRGVNGARIVIN